MNIERRKSPRTQPDKLTYIHLQSDNGAIILNFSEDGLCFRSAGPILETGPIHFTFSLQSGQQPQAIGELVWTDKARKKGGLRLTDFPADARNPLNVRLHGLPNQRIEKIRLDSVSLAQEPVTEVLVHEKSPASDNTPGPAKTVSLAAPATVPLARTAPSRAIVRIARIPKQTYRPPRIPWDAWRDWPTINWGVVVGFAVFIIFAVVLVHAYADRLGQSFAYGQPAAGNLSAAEQRSPVPQPETSQNSSPLQELRTQIAALESEYGDEGRGRNSEAGGGGIKSEVPEPSYPQPAANSPDNPAAETNPEIPAQPVQTDDDAGKPEFSADTASNSAAASPDTSNVEEADADPGSATYFDVGNFKDLARAAETTDDLGKLGFRAIVVHKTLLWMGSFHVVVGPFGSDQDSEAARSRLETLGFSPRLAKTH